MKILAISDTHGNVEGIKRLENLMERSDYIFHLGDHDYDMKPFREKFDTKIYSVKGNCDFGGEEFVFDINGFKIMLVHGNKYHVKGSLLRLKLRAKELGVSAVFYGHTHVPKIEQEDGVFFINPGCMTKRAYNTYCLAELNNGELVAQICEIKDF